MIICLDVQERRQPVIPDRMRTPCVKLWIFQQHKPPMPGGTCGRGATVAAPTCAVIGITAQIFPGQVRGIEPQHIQVSRCRLPGRDRKSVVSGKSVSVRVALGGRRIIKKKKKKTKNNNTKK